MGDGRPRVRRSGDWMLRRDVSVRARIAHTYFYPAKISDIASWHASVVSSGRDVEETERLLDGYLPDEYVKCGSHNSDNNDARAAQLFRANQALVVMLILVAAAGIPYIGLSLNRIDVNGPAYHLSCR